MFMFARPLTALIVSRAQQKGVPTRLNQVVALPTTAEILTSPYSPFWTVTEGSK